MQQAKLEEMREKNFKLSPNKYAKVKPYAYNSNANNETETQTQTSNSSFHSTSYRINQKAPFSTNVQKRH